jgi:hypothetical protein
LPPRRTGLDVFLALYIQPRAFRHSRISKFLRDSACSIRSFEDMLRSVSVYHYIYIICKDLFVNSYIQKSTIMVGVHVRGGLWP